jgi:hypothetical protein
MFLKKRSEVLAISESEMPPWIFWLFEKPQVIQIIEKKRLLHAKD